jgi:short-subunit dehydrogenase
MVKSSKTIIISGASSGLGAALAVRYSKDCHKLFLVGRSRTRLNKVTKICQANGADATFSILDVTDLKAVEKYIKEITINNSVDIVIACAGVSAGTLNGPETINQVNRIFATNINGVLNIVMPVIPDMIKQKKGNIAIVSSMAGFIGLSSAPSYSASKGAIRLFSDALRGYLRPWNIHVSTIIPGYIETPMTSVNNFPMPLMTSADKAAEKIINGIEANKNIIAFPYIMYILIKLFTFLPSGLLTYFNSKLPGKPSFEEKK